MVQIANANGYASFEEYLNSEMDFSYEPRQAEPSDVVTHIVLERARFLTPRYWLPEPADWPVRGRKIYSEDEGEGRKLAEALDAAFMKRSLPPSWRGQGFQGAVQSAPCCSAPADTPAPIRLRPDYGSLVQARSKP